MPSFHCFKTLTGNLFPREPDDETDTAPELSLSDPEISTETCVHQEFLIYVKTHCVAFNVIPALVDKRR